MSQHWTLQMMSKGKDTEALFPNVVKNVVCKHLEVKKLVYIYLIHYAEKQPDQALLSINNFQKVYIYVSIFFFCRLSCLYIYM